MMPVTKKATAEYCIRDLAGSPLAKIKYKVTDILWQKIVEGTTNSKGCTYKFVKPIGTIVRLQVSYDGVTYREISTDHLVNSDVKINKIFLGFLFETILKKHDGSSGNYRRKTHPVVSGDTLDSIAKQYGTTRKEIADLNGLKAPYTIYAGRTLKLPVQSRSDSIDAKPVDNSQPSSIPSALYIVKRGDVLSTIAQAHGISTSDLAKSNNIRINDIIYTGQELIIPDKSKPQIPSQNDRPQAPTEPSRPDLREDRSENNGNPEETATLKDGYIVLRRKWQTENSTIGEFEIIGTNIKGFMLEEKGPSTTVSGLERRVPEGIYNLVWHNGTRFKGVLRIYNHQVSQSRAILIHAGNTAKDTEGCILPGITRGEDRVNSSRAKLKEVLKYVKEHDISKIRLVIIDAFENSKNKNNLTYSLSMKGMSLLQEIEELRLKPYDDQTGHNITEWIEGATIGYGKLIQKSEWMKYKDGIKKSEADILFKNILQPFEETVNRSVTVSISQNQYDALVILAYNIGETGFKNSSVVKIINNPNAQTPYKDLELAWKAWNKSQGKVMRGLIRRRNSEWDIYTNGVYKKW